MIHVKLTEREARALCESAQLVAGAFAEDLERFHEEHPDFAAERPTPLLSGAAKIALGLKLTGADAR